MSEKTISDDFEVLVNPTTESCSMSDLFDITEQSNQTEHVTSEPIPSKSDLAIVVYDKPVPKTLNECINKFRTKAMKKVSKLRVEASTSIEPHDMDGSWKLFQKWMSSEVERMNSFAEASIIWDD